MPKKKEKKKGQNKKLERDILVFISYATKDSETFQIPKICEKITKFKRVKDVLY
ncbi:MAG: hypothetical protein GF329_10325, partial [Candidatus Lokiarchaeota archaeon]|nr:hypothetical protein [Candidatus Lokiarchaeota archaeon]